MLGDYSWRLKTQLTMIKIRSLTSDSDCTTVLTSLSHEDISDLIQIF